MSDKNGFAVGELIFPEERVIRRLGRREMLYGSIDEAKRAYDVAFKILHSDADNMTRETALELMLISQYTLHVRVNFKIEDEYRAECKNGNEDVVLKDKDDKIQEKSKYFAEWIDGNLDIVPVDMQIAAVKHYCKGIKLMFSIIALNKYHSTEELSKMSGWIKRETVK